ESLAPQAPACPASPSKKNLAHPPTQENSPMLHWYAFRMHSRTPHQAQAIARKAGFDTYYALRPILADTSYQATSQQAMTEKALMPSVIFIKCTSEFAQRMRDSRQMWPYTLPGTSAITPIAEADMQVFRAAVESGCRKLEVIDPNLAVGQRVRVLGGIFAGQEGYIVKLRGDKRFVITIPGVVAIATIYIPPHLLAPAT
ncbi:MAG: hypothetical protein Q4B68_05055, partial [Bacteroidales bacterium]|nr:hypothetical protein [Bacteroidales bacterium]